MNYRFAVIGLGRFGTKIARTLSQRGAEVLAIDFEDSKTDNLRDDVAYAVTMDSTDIKALQSQRIQDMDAVVVAIGENFEALLLTTAHLLDMKVKRVIARAATPQQRMILEKMGVTEILSPEDEVGILVAERLLHPSVMTFLQLPDGYEIAEIVPPKGVWNKTVGDIQLREIYNLNLITLKREYEMEKNGEITREKHILGVPKSDTVIYENDTLILLGQEVDIERFIEVNR
ncbi:MAG: TrkA family potassium uptake protein [Bacteroidetes bacterium]|nr:MAG: TrkA family potassium uptake protein [Bacteroidota bacterium]